MNFNKMIQPALIAGAATGVISAIPILNICNICCLYYIAGGMLAAYLYARKDALSLESGLVSGGLAGAIGGVLSSILGFILGMLMQMLGMSMSAVGGSGANDLMAQAGMGAVSGVLGLIFGIAFGLVLGGLFGALGGAVYSMIAKK